MCRIHELESLRAIWAMLILMFHATQAPLFNGWSRVDLFFVLSGYLSARKILNSDCQRRRLFGNFASRCLRIMPEYFFLIVLVTAMELVTATENIRLSSFARLVAALTLTQNIPLYWSDSSWYLYPRYLSHTWTLAIELQFSLLLSLLNWLIGPLILIPLAIALLINTVILRADGLHPWVFMGRSDGLALGIALAVALNSPNRRKLRTTWLGLFFVSSLGLGYLGWFLGSLSRVPITFDQPLGLLESLAVFAANLFYTGLIGLVVCHANHPILHLLRVKWLRIVGGLSYGIYLYSFIAIGLAEAMSRIYPGIGCCLTALLALAIAIIFAAASRAAIEEPVFKLCGRHRAAGRENLLRH